MRHPAEHRRPDRHAGKHAHEERDGDAPVDHARDEPVADDLVADDDVLPVAGRDDGRIERALRPGGTHAKPPSATGRSGLRIRQIAVRSVHAADLFGAELRVVRQRADDGAENRDRAERA